MLGLAKIAHHGMRRQSVAPSPVRPTATRAAVVLSSHRGGLSTSRRALLGLGAGLATSECTMRQTWAAGFVPAPPFETAPPLGIGIVSREALQVRGNGLTLMFRVCTSHLSVPCLLTSPQAGGAACHIDEGARVSSLRSRLYYNERAR